MSYKSEVFKIELDYIKNDKMREVATELVEMLPDYTFEIPASASGKYHPSYTSGKGGLVRHTQAAVRIAKELLRLEMYSSINLYHDYIIIALILMNTIMENSNMRLRMIMLLLLMLILLKNILLFQY